MSDHVSWILELNIQPGRDAAFRALMAEMVAATKAGEPGTLNYEWSVTADGTQCHTYERYVDSAATMVHLGNFGSKYAERFMGILAPVGFTVYGAPDAAVKEALAGFNPTYVESVGGFSR
jgi:quinol monooxygenase YgiN